MDKTLFGVTVQEIVDDIKVVIPILETVAAWSPTKKFGKAVDLLKAFADNPVLLEKLADLLN